MLGQNIQYEFEPCEGDSVEIITVHDESTQNILDNEGKKCVATVQKDVKVRRLSCISCFVAHGEVFGSFLFCFLYSYLLS